MADISDVMTTLQTLITSFVYPTGTSNPSIVGVQVTIEQGFPIRNQLDEDLLAGFMHVSIFPTSKEKVTTRFERKFEASVQTPPTLGLTVLNNTLTVTGTVSLPQAMMVILNGVGYAYQVQLGDTLSAIATNLAAAIPGGMAAGVLITVTGNVYSLIGRVTTSYKTVKELKRQEREIMISIWSPTPALRTALGSQLDPFLAGLFRIALPDNTFGLLWYDKSEEMDSLEKSIIYRRDLFYKMEYATTVTETDTTITDALLNSLAVVQSLS